MSIRNMAVDRTSTPHTISSTVSPRHLGRGAAARSLYDNLRDLCLTAVAVLLASSSAWGGQSSGFRVLPYLQNPTTAAMTILWFSNSTSQVN